MPVARRYEPKVLAAVVIGIAVTALGISLGNWQSRRGDEKAVLQASRDAAEAAAPVSLGSRRAVAEVAGQLPRRVELHGEFLPARTVYVDNRWLDGAAGFQIVTPLRVNDEVTVLVSRGWIARDRSDPALMPKVDLPSGPVAIDGLAVERVPRLLELGERPVLQVPGIWPNLEIDDYRLVTGLAVAAFVVQQTSATADNLRRVWPSPSLGIEKHRGYALQWYGLAALSAGLTLFFGARALRGAGQ